MDNGIDIKHPEYMERYDQWQACRNFDAGAWALRRHEYSTGGSESAYIEKLSSKMPQEEYRKYIKRAMYDNMVRRMKNSLIGLVFAKEPEYECDIDYLVEDIDMMETPLEEFAENIVNEVLITGRCGVLVDRPMSSPGMTRLEAESMNVRPYAVFYKAENIVNWDMSRINNRWQVSRVVLFESEDRYRELILDENGLYHVIIWVKPDKKRDWEIESDTIPIMNNQPMRSIPFYFFGPYSGTCNTYDSPILDIVEIAMSRWRTSADLEHARFSCSVPTPYFLGFNEADTKNIKLGGLNGIVSMSPDSKVGFLEYNGQGTEPLERAMQQKAEMIAAHGVDLLQDKADAEATATVKMRISVQTATLADMANSISRIMSQMLSLMSQWAGGSGNCEIKLNTDYSAHSLSSADLLALIQGVVSGTIPQAVLNERLRKSGLTDKDDEELQAELDMAVERDTGTMV